MENMNYTTTENNSIENITTDELKLKIKEHFTHSIDNSKLILNEAVFSDNYTTTNNADTLTIFFDKNKDMVEGSPDELLQLLVDDKITRRDFKFYGTEPIDSTKGYYTIKKFKYPDHYKMTIYVNCECDAEYHGFTSTGKRRLSAYPDGLWEEIEYRLDRGAMQQGRPLPGPYSYETQLGVDYSLYKDDGTGFMGIVVLADTYDQLAFAQRLCKEYGIGEK